VDDNRQLQAHKGRDHVFLRLILSGGLRNVTDLGLTSGECALTLDGNVLRTVEPFAMGRGCFIAKTSHEIIGAIEDDNLVNISKDDFVFNVSVDQFLHHAKWLVQPLPFQASAS
jgi:hypothetical protein